MSNNKKIKIKKKTTKSLEYSHEATPQLWVNNYGLVMVTPIMLMVALLSAVCGLHTGSLCHWLCIKIMTTQYHISTLQIFCFLFSHWVTLILLILSVFFLFLLTGNYFGFRQIIIHLWYFQQIWIHFFLLNLLQFFFFLISGFVHMISTTITNKWMHLNIFLNQFLNAHKSQDHLKFTLLFDSILCYFYYLIHLIAILFQ